VICPALEDLPTLTHKYQDFWEKVIDYKIRDLFSLHILFGIFFIVKIIQGGVNINIHKLLRTQAHPKGIYIYQSARCHKPQLYI
jgi:hypothetical protein